MATPTASPRATTIQYFDGTSWQTAPGQLKAPGTPQPNANEVVFRPVTAQLFRVVVTPTGTFGVGIKEAQAFDTTPLGIGFWANENGKAIIAAGGSTDGVCDAGTYLRGYAPFADLSATATCDQVASYAAGGRQGRVVRRLVVQHDAQGPDARHRPGPASSATRQMSAADVDLSSASVRRSAARAT